MVWSSGFKHLINAGQIFLSPWQYLFSYPIVWNPENSINRAPNQLSRLQNRHLHDMQPDLPQYKIVYVINFSKLVTCAIILPSSFYMAVKLSLYKYKLKPYITIPYLFIGKYLTCHNNVSNFYFIEHEKQNATIRNTIFPQV